MLQVVAAGASGIVSDWLFLTGGLVLFVVFFMVLPFHVFAMVCAYHSVSGPDVF